MEIATEGLAGEPTGKEQTAFYGRVERLYDLYEDWTGETEEVDDRVDASKRCQSDGSACIDPGVAISTFVTFVVQLADGLGLPKEDLLKVVSEVYDGLEAEDEAEDAEASDEDEGEDGADDDDDDDDDDDEPS